MSIDYPALIVDVPAFRQRSAYGGGGKRCLDLLIVLLLMPVVLPLLGLILFVTLVEGGRPLYLQRRVGLGGALFSCWKVRTMIKDADCALAALLARDEGAAREWQTNQKLARDPRVTRFGRFLRRTSLDELPQLWNVMTGTMSLVGPRPFTPDQHELYVNGGGSAYFRLRPGVTGLWQVSRRNAGSFVERVGFDEDYARQVSLATDLHILWRTATVVLRATGL